MPEEIKRPETNFLSSIKKIIKSPISFLKEAVKDFRKLSLLIILLSIPVTVGLALIQQELRSRAADERQIVLGMSNRGGNIGTLESVVSGVEEVKTETGRYPAIYPIWVSFADSFPSKEITDALDSRGIALAIFLEPVGPGIGRADGRFIFSANTAETVAPGQIKFNSSSPTGITRIYVSKSSSGTENPAGLASTWVPGSSISMFGSLSNGNVDYANSNHFDFTVNSTSETTTHWVVNVTVTDPGSLSGLFSEGRAVFITMADTNARKYANSAIANGSFDAWFQKFAQDAQAYGKPVLLRYAHEMNGPIFPWGSGVNGDGQPNHRHGGSSGYGRYRYFNVGNTPQSYVNSWRRVYNTVKPIAPNLKMFWCPSRQVKETMDKTFPENYPGNAYIDYVGFDAYSTPNPKNDQQMVQIYKGAMNKVIELSNGRKPVFIGETGVTNHNLPADFNRGDWVRNGYQQVFNYDGNGDGKPDWPQLAGIIYFNFDISGQWGAEHNWLLSGVTTAEAQTNALPAYRDIASRTRFQGSFEGVEAPVTPAPVTEPPVTVPPVEQTNDSQRKADVAAIQKAVEAFRTANGFYPRFNTLNGLVYGWAKAHILEITSYLNPIPIGPGLLGTETCANNNYKGYVYAGNSTNYAIFTNLENSSDPAVTSRKQIPVYTPTGFTTNGVTASWTGGSCPGTYNYWVTGSSPTPTFTPTPTPTPGPVKTAQITTFADSFVRSDNPSTNYGTGIRLRADGSPKVITYLKFNISSVVGKNIISAKLRLRVSDDSGSGSSNSFNLRRIDPSSWTEGGVTYNNRPALGSILTSFNGKGAGQTLEIDVKNLLGSSSSVSYAIATEGSDEMILNSKDAGSNHPQLIITYQ